MTDKQKPISMGFFKYDQFPFIVCSAISGWADDGKPITPGLRFPQPFFKRSALIIAMELKQGEFAKIEVEKIEEEYRQILKQAQKDLLERLFSEYPTLQRKKD